MNISSRRGRLFQRFPDPVVGYELSPEHGYFSVIIPEATTNLVTNPSVEWTVLTGYTTFGGAMASTATWQAYGGYGIQLTPAVSTESGFYYGNVTLAVGTTYTASVTIQGEEGKKYYIWFATTAGALIGMKRLWIGTGHKQRIHVTHTETAGAARRVYVTRDAAYPDQNIFYADGLQVEAKAYPTTYCDGDQVGFVIGQYPYAWTGAVRGSTSTRSAQTRAGGREMSLLGFGFRVLAIMGLGMAPLVDQALPMPGRGELAQGTGTTAREFSLVGALYADSSGPRHLQAQRDDLVDAFKPDLTTFEQPLILRYQACDEDGDPLGDSLDIVCKYMGGLEGNWDNHQQERIVLNFKMHLPLIQSTYDNGMNLTYQETIADADYIIRQLSNGSWAALGTGADDEVFSLAIGNDGYIYAGGVFTSMGGVANTAGIARWDGTAWSAMGNGGAVGAVVYAIATAPNGDVYVGGSFTDMGGVANTQHIAKWNGTTWVSLGATGANQTVYALVWSGDSLFAGGGFTTICGIAANYFAMALGGTVWYAFGTGADAGILELAAAADQTIYIGGDMTSINGTPVQYIAKMPRVEGGWTGFDDMGGGANASVYGLAIGVDGSIYASGLFTSIGGVEGTKYIARWNGSTWESMQGGADGFTYTLAATPDGKLYVGGSFDHIGYIDPVDRIAVWNNRNFELLNVDFPGSPTIWAAAKDVITGTLYLGFSTFGTATVPPTTVPNIPEARSYPTVIFTGPGELHELKNYTTGKSIFFNLTLMAGEVATLNLSPTNLSFISSFRGNILSTILTGSNLNFDLLPGNNNITAFIFGSTTADTKAMMLWKNQYWSLDGAAWK